MTSPPSLLVPVWKQVGYAPLRCVEAYRLKHPEYDHVKISYAGRLDPMARGVLLLLVGDANKQRREYEHLDKEYEVEIVCGFSTDTGDLMGRISQVHSSRFKVHRGSIEQILNTFIGRIEQQYPVYSAAKVGGKPLYWWARQGRMNEISIPTHQVRIDSIKLIKVGEITKKALEAYVVETIAKVSGDFRQQEIIELWKKELAVTTEQSFPLISIRVVCGSGTYMRTLVEDIGITTGMPMCAYRITRNKVGEYSI